MAEHDTPSEKNVEAGVHDTFPASDPVSATASAGSRAVSPKDMMHDANSTPRKGGDTDVSAHFESKEKAKLAVETVVREGPVDRRRTEVETDGSGATVTVHAKPEDAGRVDDLLKKDGGQKA